MSNDKYIVKNFYKNIAQDIPPLLQYQFLVTITPGMGVRNGVEEGVDWDKLQLFTQGATIPNVRADIQFLDNYGEEITRRYFVEGIYPTDVPEIQMNYKQGSSSIKEGAVTFAMQYFREVDPKTPTSDLFAEYFT